MASRSQSWFDAQMLLPGEDLVRTGAVRVRTDSAPYWWEGELILTSDRLFFLPHTANPLIGDTAFWLDEIRSSSPTRRDRFVVATDDSLAEFDVFDPIALPVPLRHRESPWLRGIASALRMARPRSAFRPPLDGGASRRAAG